MPPAKPHRSHRYDFSPGRGIRVEVGGEEGGRGVGWVGIGAKRAFRSFGEWHMQKAIDTLDLVLRER